MAEMRAGGLSVSAVTPRAVRAAALNGTALASRDQTPPPSEMAARS